MEAELKCLILWFDYGFLMQDIVHKIDGMMICIEATVENRTILDKVDKDGNTTEQKIQIVNGVLRESYAGGGEIYRLNRSLV